MTQVRTDAPHDFGEDGVTPRPLTAMAPLLLGGRTAFRVAAIIARLFGRLYFWRPVQRLGFLYAMRWTVVEPFAGDAPVGRSVDRTSHLLFETNFSGGWAEYLEGFGRVVPRGMKLLFWRTLSYPGVQNLATFGEFVRTYDQGADHYYFAYRGLDPVGLRDALDTYRQRTADAPAHVQPAQNRKIGVRAWRQGPSPRWLSVILRVDDDRVAALRTHLSELERDFRTHGVDHLPDWRTGLQTPFAVSSRVHFARLVVIDTPSGSYLLFTATVDGGQRYRKQTRPMRRRSRRPFDIDIALAELIERAEGPMRAIFSHCVGYPVPVGDDGADADALIGFLLDHSARRGPLTSISYSVCPQASVSELRRAIAATRDRRTPAGAGR